LRKKVEIVIFFKYQTPNGHQNLRKHIYLIEPLTTFLKRTMRSVQVSKNVKKF